MAQGGEISFTMTKAKELLDFEPKYSLRNSILSIKEWIDAGGLEADIKEQRQFGSGIDKE